MSGLLLGLIVSNKNKIRWERYLGGRTNLFTKTVYQQVCNLKILFFWEKPIGNQKKIGITGSRLMDRLTDFSLKITQLNRNWSTDTGVNKNICGAINFRHFGIVSRLVFVLSISCGTPNIYNSRDVWCVALYTAKHANECWWAIVYDGSER